MVNFDLYYYHIIPVEYTVKFLYKMQQEKNKRNKKLALQLVKEDICKTQVAK